MSIDVFRSLLNNNFLIYSLTNEPDGQGGYIKSWFYVAEVVGRIRPASTSEIEKGTLNNLKITHVLYVEHPTIIERGARVTLSKNGSVYTYEIVGVREPSLTGHHVEIDCNLYQTETPTEGGS